ncbi:hypothetical protein Mapa_016368 [Marchantia paleacea]|nr:hypothetical protein Mapa_016368 [Marchantia paleacea]
MRPAELSQAGTVEWEELLQILRLADSPVGEAVHWLESRGYGDRFVAYGEDHMAGKRRRVCELWRLVPDLLASEVVYVEEEEATKRTGNMGSCIWMQTLPSAMQTSVLTFLNVEHNHFRSKDLEALARRILQSPVEADYWVFQAARSLLLTSSPDADQFGSSSSTEEQPFGIGDTQMSDYHALPEWLDKCREHTSPMFSWLPLEKSYPVEEVQDQDETHLSETCESLQPTSVEVPAVQQPTDKLFDHERRATCSPERRTHERTIEDKDRSEIEIMEAEAGIMDLSKEVNGGDNIVNEEDDKIARAALGEDLYLQALSLGRDLRTRSESGLPKDIYLVRSTPKFASLLSAARAWEVDDEVTLLLVETLLVEQDGYAWSTQVLHAIILPKLYALEKPATRILMTALTQAGKIHPRAVMDSVMFPLICSKNGASSIQCEILNRLVKDCLTEDLILCLLQKMFVCSRESKHDFSSNLSWSWTEGVVGVVQNLLSHKVNIDQDCVASLVQALDAAVAEFPTSLKFGNLLLNLVTKHGPRLKSHKALLHQVVDKSRTFLTKSVQSKLASL